MKRTITIELTADDSEVIDMYQSDSLRYIIKEINEGCTSGLCHTIEVSYTYTVEDS